MTKTCPTCKILKDVSEFHFNKRYRSGVSFYCKDCESVRDKIRKSTPEAKARKRELDAAPKRKTYHKKCNATPEGKLKQRERGLLNSYNLSIKQFEDLLLAQKGVCAVCRLVPLADRLGRLFHVDHDHNCCPGKKSCGKCIRGLLCHRCNVGMGLLNDDPFRLRQAADYLTAGRLKMVHLVPYIKNDK